MFASGFSQKTVLPASAAAIAISAWESPGVQMSTTSMSGRATTARQSVACSSKPSLRAAAATPASSRPQTTFMRASIGRSKKRPTWRQAFAWARPMNWYPIIATFTVLATPSSSFSRVDRA